MALDLLAAPVVGLDALGGSVCQRQYRASEKTAVLNETSQAADLQRLARLSRKGNPRPFDHKCTRGGGPDHKVVDLSEHMRATSAIPQRTLHVVEHRAIDQAKSILIWCQKERIESRPVRT
jgi:hypothetical protein